MAETMKFAVEAPFDLVQLEISDGTVLLVKTPMVGGERCLPSWATQKIGEDIERGIREQTGKRVMVLMAAPDTTIEAIPPEVFEQLGWTRAQPLEE